MERMMRRTFLIFLILTLLAFFGSIAVAEEKVVQLTVPGCSA
jgi:hypothetical protein